MLTQQTEKIRVRLESFNHELLTESCNKIIENAKAIESNIVGPIPLPTDKRIYCVLRSPHVNKDAREHFEIRTHKRIIDIYQPTETTFESLRNLDLSPGVDVEVKSYE